GVPHRRSDHRLDRAGPGDHPYRPAAGDRRDAPGARGRARPRSAGARAHGGHLQRCSGPGGIRSAHVRWQGYSRPRPAEVELGHASRASTVHRISAHLRDHVHLRRGAHRQSRASAHTIGHGDPGALRGGRGHRSLLSSISCGDLGSAGCDVRAPRRRARRPRGGVALKRDAMASLYDYLDSGNGYKVRLLLAQLERPYRWIELDIMEGRTRTPGFLSKNPNGRIPTLELDDGACIAESNAILWYIAEGTAFVPDDRIGRAQALQWMFFE